MVVSLELDAVVDSVAVDADVLGLGSDSDSAVVSVALLSDEVTVGALVGSTAPENDDVVEAASLGAGWASVVSASSATAAPVTAEPPRLPLLPSARSGGATA